MGDYTFVQGTIIGPSRTYDKADLVYRIPFRQTVQRSTFGPRVTDVVGRFDTPDCREIPKNLAKNIPDPQLSCQHLDAMGEKVALEEYIRWAFGAGFNTVMDGDATREEYYAALMSWLREDSISLEQELPTLMKKNTIACTTHTHVAILYRSDLPLQPRRVRDILLAKALLVRKTRLMQKSSFR